MSRIGKTPIKIPTGTEIVVSNNVISVKGKGGELRRKLHKAVSVDISDGFVTVSPNEKTSLGKALWGTFAAHINNMLTGVNEPFCKKLIVEGVGYKVDLSGSKLTLNIGFSHPVIVNVPSELTVSVEKNVIKVCGIDKELVGEFTANIRAIKKPEPYKGKGIRYDTEVVRRKQGKRVVS